MDSVHEVFMDDDYRQLCGDSDWQALAGVSVFEVIRLASTIAAAIAAVMIASAIAFALTTAVGITSQTMPLVEAQIYSCSCWQSFFHNTMHEDQAKELDSGAGSARENKR
jgi:hypothetical protein